MHAPAWMLAASMLLGGLLPLDAHTRERWAPSGAWRLPVGDPYGIARERPPAPGPFFVLRSVEWSGFKASHQGADLGCGRSGLPVVAAAAGVVVRAADHGEYGGYGSHIVLAHRLGGGVLAYTVYAHLREASLRVKAGQRVRAGQPLARVGATGRVTTPHLHFEVRIAGDPEEQWEFARVEDPLAFIEARLPTHRADSTAVDSCLEWAESAALLAPDTRDDDALTREAWWRMLAASVTGPPLDPALWAEALRDSLIAADVLAADAKATPSGAPAPWSEVAPDLARARAIGLRLGASPFRRGALRALCSRWLGSPEPATRTSALSGRAGHPTALEAVLLIADLAGPQPEPPRPAKRARAHPPARRRIGPAWTDPATAATTASDSGS